MNRQVPVLSLVVLMWLLPINCFGQGSALVVTGRWGKHFLGETVESTPAGPGVEIIGNVRRRVGGSFFFSPTKLAPSRSESSFSYEGGGVTNNVVNVTLKSFKPAYTIGGMLYVNVSPWLRKFPVEPVVGAGGGITLLRYDRKFESYTNGLQQSSSADKKNTITPVLKLAYGANVFPWKFLFFSALGGRLYGMEGKEITSSQSFFEVRAGITWGGEER